MAEHSIDKSVLYVTQKGAYVAFWQIVLPLHNSPVDDVGGLSIFCLLFNHLCVSEVYVVGPKILLFTTAMRASSFIPVT